MYNRKDKARNGSRVNPVFDGLTVQKIAQYANVSKATAGHWKRGNRDPSPQALKLIELHATGRVMPGTRQWQAITFQGDNLHPGNGDSLNPAQLQSLRQILGMNNDLLRQIDQHKKKRQEAEDYIQYLERHADRAPVIELPAGKMRRSITADIPPENTYFNKNQSD